VAGRIIFQMDKTEPEDKVVLGDEQKRGIQPDMGSAYYIGITVDKQNRKRDMCLCSSDTTNDEDNLSFKMLYHGIIYH
jgi:hypothetical protein